jgi:hypothetical protein
MSIDYTVDMRVKHKIGDMMVRQIVLEEERDEARRQLAEVQKRIAELTPSPAAEGGDYAV